MLLMQLQRLFPATIQFHYGSIGIAVCQFQREFHGDLPNSSFKYFNIALNGKNAFVPKVSGRRRVFTNLINDDDLCGHNVRFGVIPKVNRCYRLGPICLPAIPPPPPLLSAHVPAAPPQIWPSAPLRASQ